MKRRRRYGKLHTYLKDDLSPLEGDDLAGIVLIEEVRYHGLTPRE